MGRRLESQVRDFEGAMVELVKLYQFRDRSETVAYGLSVSQAYALRFLHEKDALAMGELAAELNLTVSSTTRVVDPLVERSLVRRIQSPEDRRVWQVSLTTRGSRLWDKMHRELLAIDAEVLGELSPAEREAVIDTIARLARATAAWRATRRSTD